jgi:hypothetical protein
MEQNNPGHGKPRSKRDTKDSVLLQFLEIRNATGVREKSCFVMENIRASRAILTYFDDRVGRKG